MKHPQRNRTWKDSQRRFCRGRVEEGVRIEFVFRYRRPGTPSIKQHLPKLIRIDGISRGSTRHPNNRAGHQIGDLDNDCRHVCWWYLIWGRSKAPYVTTSHFLKLWLRTLHWTGVVLAPRILVTVLRCLICLTLRVKWVSAPSYPPFPSPLRVTRRLSSVYTLTRMSSIALYWTNTIPRLVNVLKWNR